MSSASGDSRKRPGIFDSFRAAMTPAALPEDDGAPIVPPRTVTIATVLAIVAGLIFVFIGAVSLATTDQQLDQAVKTYNASVADCITKFGGIGDAVVVPESASDADKTQSDTCKQYVQLTPDTIAAAKRQNVIISVVIVVIGLIAGVGGWFLRAGVRWSRLMVVGAVLVSVILTMMFSVQNLFTLVGTLLTVVAVMLSYIGKGGVYFARMRARRATT